MDERSLEDDTVLLVQGPVDEADIKTTKSVRAEFSIAQLHVMSWAKMEGSVRDDQAEVRSHALDGVLRNWSTDQHHRMDAVSPRVTGTKIQSEDANAQSGSRLLALPSELRLRIYEYVFGACVVHIRTRHCPPTARPLPRFGVYDRYSYVVCPRERSWEQNYAISKQSTSTEEFETNRENYRVTHMACQLPLHDLSAQEYVENAEFCRTTRGAYIGGYFGGSDNCEQHPQEQIDTFGPAPQGLALRHAGSGIDFNLLLTSRQIYREAFPVPYANYTFDFELSDLQHWASKILYNHQARAIKSAHFSESSSPPFFTSPGALGKVFQLLPGLTQLRLSTPNVIDQELLDMMVPPYNLESAEVITYWTQ